MFDINCSTSELISKGDVVTADGNTLEEVFSSIANSAKLLSDITSESLLQELLDREHVLSTAVGNGIAIPHPRRSIVKNTDESCIIVAYLKNPIEMQAPDFRKVSVMFILLSASSQFHIKCLSSLASVFRNERFKKGIQDKPGFKDLIGLVKACEENTGI
ncbi:MAG: PTS sugar transporter subunit IIA [Treponema sp.]|nr:PTS sugar transporter subunit IIA [Spirochaetia bacterium]MDD7459227.1 PTS sugar transporter subunit IIA [Spirochaetales bacterium]MDY5812771.1 PTS sugar transporter subunit IIA [Treponema sp.]MEE1180640.1 PTS sugar transporter subunit IIA [Treponema sp.]